MKSLLIRASVRLYRLLLLRYPASFRREFGEAMIEDVRRLLDEQAAAGGWTGLARSWVRIGKDLARPLPGALGRSSFPAASEPWHRPTTGSWGWADDFRGSLRSLGRDPTFTGILAGVLGASVALFLTVFTVVNAYLIRPLPYPEADRLVRVGTVTDLSWSEVGDVFEKSVSWDLDVFTLIGGARPNLVRGSWVTPDFLEAYGVEPALGRNFRAEEGDEGAAPVALISHEVWQEQFGGDLDVIGESFRAFTSDRPDHAESFRVVGVLPEDFWHLNDFVHVLVPLNVERSVYAGRLRPGLPLSAAEDRLTELALSRISEAPPDFRVNLVPLHESVVASVRPTLRALQLAVVLVLVIACFNATVLLLIRTAARSREFGVRRAVGSPRLRLVRLVALEAILLAAASAAIGLLAAAALVAGVSEWVATGLGLGVPGGFAALRIDGTVLGTTLLAALAMAAVFTLAPLSLGMGGSALAGLGRRSQGGGAGLHGRLRGLLVGAEVALSMALLAGAALMVRSAIHLDRQPLGFEAAGITRGQLGLRQGSYPDVETRIGFFEAALEGVRARPEVESAALTSSSPFTGFVAPARIESDTGPGPEADAVVSSVGADYFGTMGIVLRRGREPGEGSATSGIREAVVSEDLARSLWPGEDALGQRIRVQATSTAMGDEEAGDWHTVVGVAANVIRDLDTAGAGELYLPWRPSLGFWMTLVIRRRTDHEATVAAVQEVLGSLDPEVPFRAGGPLDDVVADARRPTRVTAGVLLTFAVFALFLALLGLHGVVAYAARQSRRDVAIRMALGADRRTVTRSILLRGLAVVVGGVAVGALGGVLLGKTLAPELQGVTPGDPATHLTVAAVLLSASVMAIWIPARQASRSAPIRVLREE